MPKFGSYKIDGISIADRVTAGNAFFVGNSTVNSDSIVAVDDATSYGSNPNRPFATLDYAINQCVANRGDTIYILENHREDIGSSTVVVPDVAGLSIIGLGRGNNRPVFTATSSGATISLTGRSTRLSNVIFKCGTTGTAIKPVAGLRVDAADVMVDNCKIHQAGSSSFFIDAVRLSSTVGTVSGLKFVNNEVFCVETVSSGTNRGICLSAGSSLTDTAAEDILIANNIVKGTFDDSAVWSNSSGTVHTGVVIKDNIIWNEHPAGGTVCVDINNAITGMCIGNHLGGIGSTNIFADIFDPGSLMNAENYCSNTVDETGAISPSTVASSC